MPFLLDSNACIRLLNGTSPALATRLARHAPQEVRLSSVVRAKSLFGARHSDRVEPNLRLLSEFFAAFTSVPFHDLSAEHYGRVGPRSLGQASSSVPTTGSSRPPP